MPALAKYEVLEEIGHGGMATVYRAHDPRLSRDVAVKVIHPHLRDSVEAKTRFHAEARAVAKLRHPNIVEVFDVSSEGEPEQYLVVELVRGVTLRRLLQTRGALPPEVAASLGVEMLSALAHAHGAGVVHRDIKPENVMLEHRAKPNPDAGSEGTTPRPPDGASAASAAARSTREEPGERAHVKLMDFGIAKLLDAQGVTSTGQVLGSPAHMAPEQIEGGDVDVRADVFGLGVLLYECMVGHLPFEGNNPAQVLRRVLEGIYPSAEREDPRIGKRWSAVLDKALAREAAGRYADATAMRDVLIDELRAMGVESARAELEAWLDDPEGYAAARAPGVIVKLCDLGQSARKRGETLEAAGYFNRALAYAPHDAALMKLVASMQRARAAQDFAGRAVPLLVASALLVGAAYAGTRAIRHRIESKPPASATSAPVATAPPVVSTPEPTATAIRTAAPVREPPRPQPPRVVQRTVTFDINRPFGVLLAVDGDSIGNPPKQMTLDEKPHELRFTCMGDECEPQTKTIAAGEEPQIALTVALPLKPAALVVDGDPSLSYGLEEFPNVAVRVGVPASVQLPHPNYVAHVVERPSQHKVTVTLKPGKEAHASFSVAPP
jgi:serine/threonine-protein kinase